MEWSIQDIARSAGTTSRTLRHYDAIGLLEPSRVGGNGYRWYDEATLVRLQRILLLRELGLGLPDIQRVLDDDQDEATALRRHLDWLRAEQDRLARQVASVERTRHAREKGERLMAEDMFDGFDHTQYKDEVEERWGKDAYAASDSWWRGMDAGEKREWKSRVENLGRDWTAAAHSGVVADGPEARELAKRHVAWLQSIPGTPAASGGDTKAY